MGIGLVVLEEHASVCYVIENVIERIADRMIRPEYVLRDCLKAGIR